MTAGEREEKGKRWRMKRNPKRLLNEERREDRREKRRYVEVEKSGQSKVYGNIKMNYIYTFETRSARKGKERGQDACWLRSLISAKFTVISRWLTFTSLKQ